MSFENLLNKEAIIYISHTEIIKSPARVRTRTIEERKYSYPAVYEATNSIYVIYNKKIKSGCEVKIDNSIFVIIYVQNLADCNKYMALFVKEK